MDTLRSVPKSENAEQAVLGCILEKGNVDELIGVLEESDFYRGAHKFIFACILNMYKKNKSIDVITVAEELKGMDMLTTVGGVSYLMELKEGYMTSENILDYAAIVKDKAIKRNFIVASKEVLEEACKDKIAASELFVKAENSIFNINYSNAKSFQTIGSCIEESMINIEQNYGKGGGLLGISTGFKNLDRYLSGFQKTDFIILAARPSMGKTAFALNLASNISEHSQVAFFSLEMSKAQLSHRMLASACHLDLTRVRSGNLKDNEWVKLVNANSRLYKKDMQIDDSAALDVNEIKSKCKKLKFLRGLDVVIIDYIQLVRLKEKAYSREQEVSKVSAALKNMAKELDITVIALSQLSRAPEQRADHRPQLGDLRDSGSLEQDADVIMFLYRDEYYNKSSELKNIAEILISKNRNGQVGGVRFTWIPTSQKFGEIASDSRVQQYKNYLN
ncbi:replicative DNA helicase [Clostridium manihotivorum]|uniref:Replicative DNA helicase n=1 Tax=Clostridium manihotivorum TaxID=2320868 RepID=A0A410DSX9_9CLOT|nr:replicative DNA helicase [Clostridium manihotivorum]QAA32155.1 replicative DNA helicase [Clostridium manihotivorum]